MKPSAKIYVVTFKKSAAKEFKKLPASIRQKIIDALTLLSSNPYTEILSIKKLKGIHNLYRVRLGNYRVLYLLDNHVLRIVIIRVGHRKDVYGSL